MDCLLLSQNTLEKYLSEGMKGQQFNHTDSRFTFSTSISMIQALEVLKKRGAIQYSSLNGNLRSFIDSGIYQLDLNQYELVKALEDPDFVESYTSHASNPFETAKILSIAYNDDCWGDIDEMIKQL